MYYSQAAQPAAGYQPAYQSYQAPVQQSFQSAPGFVPTVPYGSVPGQTMPMQPQPGTNSPSSRSIADFEMFFFVNPKSGGNKGEVFLKAENPFCCGVEDDKTAAVHIFSLLDGESGKKHGFCKLREHVRRNPGKPVRCLVGGGDGTVMWADSEATKHGIDTTTQIIWGIVPLGTGNDFARVAGWGGKNPEGIENDDWQLMKDLVNKWCQARPRPHDVWQVTVNLDESRGKLLAIGKTKEEEDLEITSKTFTMINYFSIGQECQVGLHFDKHRTKSQTCNLFVYGFEGCIQELRCWSVQHIADVISSVYVGSRSKGTLIMDSHHNDGEPELIGNPESLLFLNINSYAGGKAHLWQLDCEAGVEPAPPDEAIDVEQDPGDSRLEVVTLPNIANIVLDKIDHEAKRIYSGGPYFMEYVKSDDEDVHAFFEVDGEFYHMVNPESTVVSLSKKLQVLQNDREDEDEEDHHTTMGC